MKTLIKIFGLLLVIGVVFVSCGDDDDGPTLKRVIRSNTYTIPVASSFAQGELVTLTAEMDVRAIIKDDIYDRIVDYQTQSVYPINLSNIRVVNLNAGVLNKSKIQLENFTIKVGNHDAVLIGTCIADTSGISLNLPPLYFPAEPKTTNAADTIPASIASDSITFSKILKPIFDDQIANADRKAKVTISFVPTKDIPEGNTAAVNIQMHGTYLYQP